MDCPSCGGDLADVNRFAHLVVCPYCESSLLLDEEVAKVSGKMAVLPAEESLLFVGATGRHQGIGFTVIGRVRYGYAQGYWDEWCLELEDGQSLAWLSEDGGELLWEVLAPIDAVTFEYANVCPGDWVPLGDGRYHIDEKQIAECEGAEGQLPFKVVLGEKCPFLDCTGTGGVATVEWELSGRVRIFQGKRIAWADIDLDFTAEEVGATSQLTSAPPENAAGSEKRHRVVRGKGPTRQLSCHACGGALTLPSAGATSLSCPYCEELVDLSMRPIRCPGCSATVTVHDGRSAKSLICRHCKAQLDVTRSEPSVIGSLVDSRRPFSLLKLGQKANLRGHVFEIVGRLRYRMYDEGTYEWDEFLLHNVDAGYLWLTSENGHYGISQPLHERPTTIMPKRAARGKKFKFDGIKWKVFEKYSGGVELTYVEGELPWIAKVGDKIGYMDAIAPPHQLSAEWSTTEMEWFREEYLPREELAVALGVPLEKLPQHGVAPNQPYPAGPFRRFSAVVMAAFAVLNLFLAFWTGFGSGEKVTQFTVQAASYQQEYLSPSFRIDDAPSVCEVQVDAPVDNSWVYLDVALIDAEDRAVLDFGTEVSYYHGYEGGESWSEGSRSDSAVFRVTDPGLYRLLVLGQSGTGETATTGVYGKPVSITVVQGVTLARFHMLLAIVCGGWALVEGVRRYAFEAARWGWGED